jgi:Domain of unknown function (DUF4190)
MTTDPNYAAPPPPPGERRRGAGLAITALVFGILALLLCWTVVGGILFGLVALILGFIASGRAKRGLAAGRGLAIAGIITGVLGLIISVALVVVGVSLFNSSGAKTLQQCVSDANGDQAKIQKCQDEFRRKLENKN